MSARHRFGGVRKLPSGRWQARYHDAAGNRFTAPETFATKTDAWRWLSAAETDMGRGDWHNPRLADVGFDDWAERWMVVKTPQLAPSTVVLYRYLLRNHILPDLGSMEVGRITTVDVQRWLARLHGTHLSANTVAKAYRILKMSLDGAVDAGLIPRNPCRIKGAGTERATEMSIATPEQVAALAEAAGPRWEALIFTAAYSGLRWGEMAALRRRDVDLERRTLRVTRKLAEVNGELSFGPPKTAAGRRTVGIPTFVARSIEAHLAQFAEPGDDGLIFPAPERGPMRRSNFRRRVWLPATKEVGVEGLRFHDLRHTAATLAAASGASLRALMSRIGHASAAAAIRYQHVIDGQDADIVDYLERFDRPRRGAGRVRKGPEPRTSAGLRGNEARLWVMDVAAVRSHIETVAAKFNELQRLRPMTPATARQRARLSNDLRRMFHTTRAIADELDRPGLRDRLTIDQPMDDLRVTIVELQGAFRAYQDVPAILGPTGPQLSASALHPLIWDAATRLWDDGHYRQAIQVAAQALEAKLQAVLDRADAQGADLAAGYSLGDPDKRWPRRLRLPGIDPASSTWTSAHEGAAALIRAAFMYVRNLASHPGAPEPTLEECLEQLAVLSMAARLVDRSEAVEVSMPKI